MISLTSYQAILNHDSLHQNAIQPIINHAPQNMYFIQYLDITYLKSSIKISSFSRPPKNHPFRKRMPFMSLSSCSKVAVMNV